MDGAEAEQRAVRVGALVLHAITLVLGAIALGLGIYAMGVAIAVVALASGGWALKMYGDLQQQALAAQAQQRAMRAFVAPDKFEG